MVSGRPDPFAQFVEKYGLDVTSEELPSFPRDVAAAPAELERHILVTVSSARGDAAPVRAIFVAEASDSRQPSPRDVLWWMSADSWALEQAGSDLARWAASYGYPDDDPVTLRLMLAHAKQASALAAMLGQASYRELLSIYQRELSENR
jgi:hypothetical protein